MQKKLILFICTGNIYRSRFAQALFNFYALRCSLPWEAFSRGIAASKVPGFLSPYVKEALIGKNIPLHLAGTDPIQLTIKDLEKASLRIALREEEHKEALRKLYPGWEKRCLFWQIADVDRLPPSQALNMIEKFTLQLFEILRIQELKQNSQKS
ncbi:protein-tyrosine-phosphatase [Methylacidiphilum caldifontis]|uniref:arsenate-mycothiol transferase ArsC n=1 Tax=Methylacidiphilum caldifontis TaxID=2795386 RepID=UPI001A9044E9|nr:protein-tyrosine-phosphatase [Methylacidiphilum caldifontis]QSR88183.1 protein-tyrosine-phosphatase [Methylacidiphilum caldifontis]